MMGYAIKAIYQKFFDKKGRIKFYQNRLPSGSIWIKYKIKKKLGEGYTKLNDLGILSERRDNL